MIAVRGSSWSSLKTLCLHKGTIIIYGREGRGGKGEDIEFECKQLEGFRTCLLLRGAEFEDAQFSVSHRSPCRK